MGKHNIQRIIFVKVPLLNGCGKWLRNFNLFIMNFKYISAKGSKFFSRSYVKDRVVIPKTVNLVNANKWISGQTNYRYKRLTNVEFGMCNKDSCVASHSKPCPGNHARSHARLRFSFQPLIFTFILNPWRPFIFYLIYCTAILLLWSCPSRRIENATSDIWITVVSIFIGNLHLLPQKCCYPTLVLHKPPSHHISKL